MSVRCHEEMSAIDLLQMKPARRLAFDGKIASIPVEAFLAWKDIISQGNRRREGKSEYGSNPQGMDAVIQIHVLSYLRFILIPV
ncbi:MAG: hypothetical protein AAGF67_16305 [Verrucomicrobiota bacterium]